MGEGPQWWVGYACRGALERWANLWANRSGAIGRICRAVWSASHSWLHRSGVPQLARDCSERVHDRVIESNTGRTNHEGIPILMPHLRYRHSFLHTWSLSPYLGAAVLRAGRCTVCIHPRCVHAAGQGQPPPLPVAECCVRYHCQSRRRDTPPTSAAPPAAAAALPCRRHCGRAHQAVPQVAPRPQKPATARPLARLPCVVRPTDLRFRGGVRATKRCLSRDAAMGCRRGVCLVHWHVGESLRVRVCCSICWLPCKSTSRRRGAHSTGDFAACHKSNKHAVNRRGNQIVIVVKNPRDTERMARTAVRRSSNRMAACHGVPALG